MGEQRAEGSHVVLIIAVISLLVASLALLQSILVMGRQERRAEMREPGTTRADFNLGVLDYAKQLGTAVIGFPAKPKPSPSVTDELGRVLHLAHTVLGSDEAVRRWLAHPHPGLGGMSPVVAALGPSGAERVRGVVEHGAAGQAAAAGDPAASALGRPGWAPWPPRTPGNDAP